MNLTPDYEFGSNKPYAMSRFNCQSVEEDNKDISELPEPSISASSMMSSRSSDDSQSKSSCLAMNEEAKSIPKKVGKNPKTPSEPILFPFSYLESRILCIQHC